MNFDKAYVIVSHEFSSKRLERFYKMSNSMDMEVELWPAIYGLDIDVVIAAKAKDLAVKKYKDKYKKVLV